MEARLRGVAHQGAGRGLARRGAPAPHGQRAGALAERVPEVRCRAACVRGCILTTNPGRLAHAARCFLPWSCLLATTATCRCARTVYAAARTAGSESSSGLQDAAPALVELQPVHEQAETLKRPQRAVSTACSNARCSASLSAARRRKTTTRRLSSATGACLAHFWARCRSSGAHTTPGACLGPALICRLARRQEEGASDRKDTVAKHATMLQRVRLQTASRHEPSQPTSDR